MHIINMSTRRDGMALSRIPTSISTNRYATATRTSRTFITGIATANTKRSERFFQIEPDPDLKPLPPASSGRFSTDRRPLPPNLDCHRQRGRWQADLIVAGLNPHIPSDRLAASDRVFGRDGSDSDGPLVDLKAVGRKLGADHDRGEIPRSVRGEATGDYAGAPQHGCAACTGGQTTDPYEQNTQQSPASGLSSAPQLMQS